MADQSHNKTIRLEPSWKNHVVGYALSILLIPVFGLGLVGLYWVWKRHHRVSYRVSDTLITSLDAKYQRNVDLANIDNIKIHQTWIQRKMEVGDLQLVTSTSSLTLFGMEGPHSLKKLLNQAINAEKERQHEQQKPPPAEPEHDPGTMDRMDYLTGLWQQGLVSDEDFEKERKHFENE